jgi:ketosteroid isomerase-like protein
MPFHILASALLASTLLASPATHASENDDVAAILRAEREICAAFEREDAQWLAKHLHPTFTLTNSTGKVTTREDEVADLESGTMYDVFRNRDSKVRLYGDAAVVTGITEVGGSSDGKPYAMEFQFTDTYVRTPEGWSMVASHASKLPPKP